MSALNASGTAAGLLYWKPGNSEAGHQCIGAGRVVIQDDLRIQMAMDDGTFSTNPALLGAMRHVRKKKSALHLIAFLSKKSSHGSIDYGLAVLKAAKEQGVKDVFVHTIFDGRSERVQGAARLLDKLERDMAALGAGQVVSGIGRAMALDRNGNYDLTRKAYEALVSGVGRTISRRSAKAFPA
jgi:2,3-bisphosphoglycerate-independent phosphoglycerate mutase